eukprot:COSAG06_NODE_17213_length_954_cov_1.809357_3_plen_55_part_01
MGEAHLGHQAPAEYKLRLFLGLSDLYFGPFYSAGSETLPNMNTGQVTNRTVPLVK